MKFIDRAFALAIAIFFAGAFVGATLVIISPYFRTGIITLLQARLVSPIRTATRFGDIGVFLVIFLNNSVPVVLSFLYPFIIAKITWTPSLTRQRRFMLLSCYTFIAAFLTGFFSLGTPLAATWVLGGANSLISTISGARIHGPLEFGFVLLCISEPLRISMSTTERETLRSLGDDRRLLFVSVAGLLISGAIEVFLRL